MSEQKNYITISGLKKLKDEYNKLMHEERPRVVETVAWAASNGDRSENADYIYGKRRLREIDSRIRYLTKKIEDAEPVDPSKLSGEKVFFGATVSLLDEEDNILRIHIVGEDESDVDKAKLSWKSPIARALIGKNLGDEVVVQKPKGPCRYEICELEYIAID